MQSVSITILPFEKASRLLEKLTSLKITEDDAKCNSKKLIKETHSQPHFTLEIKPAFFFSQIIWDSRLEAGVFPL